VVVVANETGFAHDVDAGRPLSGCACARSAKNGAEIEAGNATACVPAAVVTVAKPSAVTANVIGFVMVEPETAICAVEAD
jgi:hypothetical protein